MQRYVGTKIIFAKPMTRGEYNEYRGWPLPPDEAASDAGYLVEYTDGGAPNHEQHAGYISWSPALSFELAYRRSDGLPFGLAVEAMKAGQRVARAGWNGKGMFLYLIKGTDLQSGLGYGFGEYVGEPAFVSTICMKTADNKLVAGWLASQTDMLADDWYILEGN
ncbi:DUF2829 domain-containing protein [Chromobacterium phragmitis]|uniref:DUF2829 domain-containing protein n=1 Tax=Chromobacterium phragmitis TaxID=2202141 RepID=A0A344UPJ6_9NEIS|nr:DUF2829 domain-containing protein [Chromobacterium phragmitis]AXE37133.1 DUF2829 domain-containing protein [Chromobacterium phragmitis]AXE37194.1 DUF2829 domain-containing protein [Chromobacterium phragmitis]